MAGWRKYSITILTVTMKFRLTYLCLIAGLIFSSCSDVMPIEEPATKEGCIVLSASNSRMLTKSGLEYESFDVGTKYLLYGVDAAASAVEYDWANAILNKAECYETEDHYIHYGPDIHFRENIYDFYGATLCSTDEDYPDDISPIGQSPVISLNLQDGKLDDLMYSNTLKGCTRASGLLQMNFTHALSKIQVEVAKQNESQELQYAKIKEIRLINTHASGELDIVSGRWSLDSESASRTFISTPITLTTSASMVKDANGEDAHMLIFPNEDNRVIGVEIVYSFDENGSEDITASCNIYNPGSTDGSPFLFKQNYRYTLSVTISNEGVQVVTVLPQVYDWIDIPMDSYLGQPVTFGNLMWMDRNLGALSADYENDWYSTIGHYFQFGRNIPYILDVEKFKKYTGDGAGNKVNFANTTVYVMKYRNKETGAENTWYYHSTDRTYYTQKINEMARNGHGGAAWDILNENEKSQLILNAVECIYTYDHLGQKVYGVKYVAPDNPDGTGDDVKNSGPELVRNPDRISAYSGLNDAQISELYKFGFGTKLPGTETNLEKPTVWTFNNSCGRYYWQPGAPEYDPCPKGWRLPSKEDLLTLMPTAEINWDNVDYTTPVNYPTTLVTATEDIRYGRTSDGNHVCYILKNKGTSNAYRLRIMSHYTNDGLKNKRYFSIARYGATSTDTDLSAYLDGKITATSKETTMWANPIEIIKYPACGFIVPDSDGTAETVHPDLRSFGFGTVIRTSDSNPTGLAESSGNGFNYVQYLSTTDYQLSIQPNSRRSLGDQIRCVRDINAVD